MYLWFKRLTLFLLFLLAIGWGIWYWQENIRNKQTATPTNTSDTSSSPSPSASISITPSPETKPALAEPIAEFEARITKKPFGIFITPTTSPVQPENFTGYHTGVDVEYADISGDVSVYAITDGEVIFSGTVNGYGGVAILRQTIVSESVLVLYGHLDSKSLSTRGGEVKSGDIIGILGDDQSGETDGERKHLHLGIIKGDTIDYRGYVQTEGELDGWYNPLEFIDLK